MIRNRSSIFSYEVVTLIPFSYELLYLSADVKTISLSPERYWHFDLRGSHPPLGPTPIDEFHVIIWIVVERYTYLKLFLYVYEWMNQSPNEAKKRFVEMFFLHYTTS